MLGIIRIPKTRIPRPTKRTRHPTILIRKIPHRNPHTRLIPQTRTNRIRILSPLLHQSRGCWRQRTKSDIEFGVCYFDAEGGEGGEG
jgi:hypothetical protein